MRNNLKEYTMGKLKEEMQRYMKIQGYAEHTIIAYTTHVQTMAQHYKKSPLKITKAEIGDFILNLREKGRSESTVQLYYRAFCFFYRMKGLEDRVPKLAYHRRRRRMPYILSNKSVVQLLNSCSNIKYKTLFSLAYSSGLRISEIRNLTIKDLNFERNQIYVKNSKYRKDRYTVLGNNAMILLKEYIKIYKPHHYLFFHNADISRRVCRDEVYREFKKILTINGLSIKNIHLHTLRHCFATHLVENGTSIFHVMHLLGHSNIMTTMVYLHMRAPDKLKITSPIDLIEIKEAPNPKTQILLFPASA